MVLLVTMAALLTTALPVMAAGNGLMPNVGQNMLGADFWINKLQAPQQVILNSQQITAFNQAVIAKLPETMYDLRKYPGRISKEALLGMIQVPRQVDRGSEYVDGQPTTAAYYDKLATACNLQALPASITVRYAFTVNRANIRTFPTADCVTDQPADREFDNFQETAIDPAEPVIILHQSLQGDWYYVQSYNYRGWLPAQSLAIAASHEQWLQYLETAEFLTVTARRIAIGDTVFAMGAKLPLADSKLQKTASYAVKVPVRGVQGELVFALREVPNDNQVVRGFLPYTRANIISQAFKLQGERYGWGGMHDSWDCSSLILDVYRSFGFKLPRNADEQEAAAGRSLIFTDGSRAGQIQSLQPGAAVYMPGHVMLYLGEQDGQPYAIHALGGYSTAEGRISVLRVVVSDLSLKVRSGKTFLNALTTGKQFQ